LTGPVNWETAGTVGATGTTTAPDGFAAEPAAGDRAGEATGDAAGDAPGSTTVGWAADAGEAVGGAAVGDGALVAGTALGFAAVAWVGAGVGMVIEGVLLVQATSNTARARESAVSVDRAEPCWHAVARHDEPAALVINRSSRVRGSGA
jgi:hypothetical protein